MEARLHLPLHLAERFGPRAVPARVGRGVRDERPREPPPEVVPLLDAGSQVERHADVGLGRDRLRLERAAEKIAIDRERTRPERERNVVEGVAAPLCLVGEVRDPKEGEVGDLRVEAPCVPVPGLRPRVQVGELAGGDRGARRVHPEVEGEGVDLSPELRELELGQESDGVGPQAHRALVHRPVIAQQDAPLAARQRLRRLQAERREVPERAHAPALVEGARRLRAVFDQAQVVAPRDVEEAVQVGRSAEQVYDDDRLRPLGDPLLDRPRIEREGLLFDVGEDRDRRALEHAAQGRPPREGRDDHLVPRLHARTVHRQHERCGTAVRGQREAPSVKRGEALLELPLDAGGSHGAERLTREHPNDGLDGLLVDHGPHRVGAGNRLGTAEQSGALHRC